MGLERHIRITGFVPQSEVVKYINAADVCVVGSHREGWSVAMCEILACGKPVVSTDVSGARDMICEGKNGFVVADRDPENFARAVVQALSLPCAREVSLAAASSYAVSGLASDLSKLWEPLR
jgi:glycosyltransferase involved in cell wall biosynthesis